MMIFKDFLKLWQESSAKTVFEKMKVAPYHVKLWDSATREVIAKNVFLLEDDEPDACILDALSRYGTLEVDPIFNDIDFNFLNRALLGKYGNTWYRIRENLSAFYNPSWNYDGQTETVESWQDYARGTTETNEQVENAKTTTDQTRDGEVSNRIYALDSTTGADDSASVTNSGKVEVETDGGKTKRETVETIDGVHTISERKGGNQGTTMTSQILRDDIDLYRENLYIKSIVDDVCGYVSAGFWGC